MNNNEKQVYDILDKLNIVYEKTEHRAVYTADEANEFAPVKKGMSCKNLFLRNKKGEEHYLVVVQDHKRLNLKELTKKIGCTSLSFASEKRLKKYLNLEPGSVGPFGILNDENKEVIVIIDEDLKNADYVNFHPNVNTATLCLAYDDFTKYLNWCGNKIKFLEI
ncbi:prolyl-tRNA synthetase associated domain-containing protein [Anaeromicrobium sediminis]|uniref:Aminoacyl-tRNA deacylase n=1 Tax=Anaeromicrobium sediminis TaxID=1478221 RepID=A0A267MH29_9FIRM|nr:prolyl-tRNA synthetase associated domain-containing protein [Anaeromicrobium sediminis]PAB58712.1 aminoacyl-tRNA deacylase [Anaeromicrobium sediminis]